MLIPRWKSIGRATSGVSCGARLRYRRDARVFEGTMLELLREFDVAPRFREMKKRSSEIIVAVPFWGTGAIKSLGLNRNQKVRIICNLYSAGCNPRVIAKLRKKPGVTVRSNARLHAKIYGGEGFVIVGSSNASTNGLCDEGAKALGWVEANVLTDDAGMLQSVTQLFEELWADEKTFEVTAAVVADAIAAYRPPSRDPGPSTARTLLAACREHPDEFRSVYVAAYNEDVSPAANEKLAAVRQGAVANPGSTLSAADFANADGYQIAMPMKSGSWLVDVDCRRPGKERVGGCYRVMDMRLRIPGEWDLVLVQKNVLLSPLNARRLPISKEEKELLKKYAPRVLCEDEFPTLPDFLKMADREEAGVAST
jgi:hypothetical protein